LQGPVVTLDIYVKVE